MRPIKTLEHTERAADLHFLDEKGMLGISWPLRRQALDQVGGEPLKVQVHALDGALLHIEDVIDGDAIDPGLELAAEIELRQARDGAHQDFLCGILRILTIPQHAESQAADIALERSDKAIQSFTVPAHRLPCKVRQHYWHHRPRSISDFSVANSDSRSARCASSAPSTCSSATGGACSTKLEMHVPRAVSVPRDWAVPTR